MNLVTPQMLLESSVFYDIECKRDMGEVISFDNPEYAGIGVACTIDQDDNDRDWLFDESAFRLFAYMNQFKIIGGYNIINFDNPILGGALLTPENQSAKRFINNSYKGRIIDFAEDVKEALGHKAKLENISIPTLGDYKEMSGANAPNRLRNGKVLETIEYCRGDNRRLKTLVTMAVNGEELKYQTANGVKTFKTQVKLR